MDRKISDERLINIFRETILLPNIRVSARDAESIRIFQEYLESKQDDIEFKLSVFENIPQSDIHEIIKRFVKLLVIWCKYKSEITTSFTKASRNRIDKRIRKEITIIEKYQNLIEEYTADGFECDLWLQEEYQEVYGINKDLDTAYKVNKKLLHELKTKEFNILYEDYYRTSKVASKQFFRRFYEDLKGNYEVNVVHIKQMIDIL